jgi:hypothetical protein
VPDYSSYDDKYFIDCYVYNCPFCKRRNVSYRVWEKATFHWTDAQTAYVYICHCESCGKRSMHLTYTDIQIAAAGHIGPRQVYRFEKSSIGDNQLDDLFFYSVPTSLFAIDDRVPKKLRELMTEAEGCLKSNFLTGASACARKIVYEMAVLEGAEGEDYDDRIKSLKKKRPDVTDTYFDSLLTIQKVTSDKVHENSYDGWNGKHLRLILSSLKQVMQEMYVLPGVKEGMRKEIIALQKEIMGDQSNDDRDKDN